MDLERQSEIAALDTTLTTVERVLDVDGLRARIQKLEQEASDPNLWDDQSHAQRVTSELSHAQGELRRVEGLRQRLDDLPVLFELAAEEEGAAALYERLGYTAAGTVPDYALKPHGGLTGTIIFWKRLAAAA